MSCLSDSKLDSVSDLNYISGENTCWWGVYTIAVSLWGDWTQHKIEIVCECVSGLVQKDLPDWLNVDWSQVK